MKIKKHNLSKKTAQAGLALVTQASDHRTVSDTPAQAGSVERLTLCLYLPLLSLEAINQQQQAKGEPVCQLVHEEMAGRFRVQQVLPELRQQGIYPGMALSAAYAIEPRLQSLARQPALEQQLLAKLMTWASQFSAELCVEQDNAIVIEVKQSATLYKGLPALLSVVKKSYAQHFKLSANFCIAPSVQAAYCLAQANKELIIDQLQNLRVALARMPLYKVGLTDAWLSALQRMGLRYLEELWRLPRAGLVKRFGQAFLDYLDRLLGQRQDQLPIFEGPPAFSATWDCPQALSERHLLWLGIRKQLKTMCYFLRQIDSAITGLTLRLQHFKQDDTVIELAFRMPQRELKRLAQLVLARFNQVSVAAPVIAITLTTNQFQAYAAKTQPLFAPALMPASADQASYEAAPEQGAWQNLLEELNVRLGDRQWAYLAAKADHRPECAWAMLSQAPEDTGVESPLQRPFWYLNEPIPLRLKNNKLFWRTQLSFVSGPERIEAGWWDQAAIARDYYIAVDTRGQYCWIYRDATDKKTAAAQWYVQGFYA